MDDASSPPAGDRLRARDLGIQIGLLQPGRWNAITDVPGVQVGHTTLIHGQGRLRVGQGPVRTGVTVILPHDGNIAADPLFAGTHVLNGNGEMTGLAAIDDLGLLATPIALTNTHSVGVVRDALIRYAVAHGGLGERYAWSLPVVTETYDGALNDINGLHIRPEHAEAALATAASGPVAEGCVGGGTGMICHQFKGGIGTASRALPAEQGGWIVGALVQANYGRRDLLRIDGVPVGQAIGLDRVPAPGPAAPAEHGSIIVIIATSAPLLPSQCRRLAQRATIGLARVGGIGADSSGDLFLAFSTGNRHLGAAPAADGTQMVRMLPNPALTPLFQAAAEATEEAIINALCMATTMRGANDWVAHALPLDELQAAMRHYRRLA